MALDRCRKIVWLAAFVLAWPDFVFAQPKLPSSEEFGNAVYACALDSNINLSASALGSIKTFYEGQKTEGKASLAQSSKFLSMFPEADRKDMYKIYVDCILKLVTGFNRGRPGESFKLFVDYVSTDKTRVRSYLTYDQNEVLNPSVEISYFTNPTFWLCDKSGQSLAYGGSGISGAFRLVNGPSLGASGQEGGQQVLQDLTAFYQLAAAVSKQVQKIEKSLGRPLVCSSNNYAYALANVSYFTPSGGTIRRNFMISTVGTDGKLSKQELNTQQFEARKYSHYDVQDYDDDLHRAVISTMLPDLKAQKAANDR